jgi:galactokinase
VIERFRQRFGERSDVRVFRAPGRVNLIGEHTDYTLGYVMPVALELACFIATAPGDDGVLRVYSENLDQERAWPARELSRLVPEKRWTDYIVGVAQQLLRRSFEIRPAALYIRATVPEGAGLSSSAALEVATALALLAGREVAPVELARLCQQAEIEFVGMPCGIMDQYVAVLGRERSAIRIDCRSLEHEAAPLPEGVEIVAVNSMVKHALGESAYKQRTIECAAATEMLRRKHPGVETLRDANLAQLESVAAGAGQTIFRRARHVISENQRVLDFVRAAERQDLAAMGRLLIDSHRSLQHDYEVSCPELDFLVDAAVRTGLVYGARMTGGGFGGCTVNLVRAGAVDEFREAMTAEYQQAFHTTPQVYVCRPAAGAGEVTSSPKSPPDP